MLAIKEHARHRIFNRPELVVWILRLAPTAGRGRGKEEGDAGRRACVLMPRRRRARKATANGGLGAIRRQKQARMRNNRVLHSSQDASLSCGDADSAPSQGAAAHAPLQGRRDCAAAAHRGFRQAWKVHA